MTPGKPKWPGLKQHADLGPICLWVADVIDGDSEEVASAEAEAMEPYWPLKVSERDALLAAFDAQGRGRWEPVLRMMRAGAASPGLMSVIADLIEHGGFAAKADLTSHDANYLYHEYRVIARVLRAGYTERSENACYRLATRIAANLLGRTESDIVGATSRRKGALGEIRWRVVTDGATPD
ncbi:MAG: hypothetical protein E5Y89_15945 [Mesorhizobium sp.]|nr:MAG: hypothetical protein E5Y89_15945 [Mesorhizobium sp.]